LSALYRILPKPGIVASALTRAPGAVEPFGAAVAVRHGYFAGLLLAAGLVTDFALAPVEAPVPRPGPGLEAAAGNLTVAVSRKGRQLAAPTDLNLRANRNRHRSDASGVRLFCPPPSVLPASAAGDYLISPLATYSPQSVKPTGQLTQVFNPSRSKGALNSELRQVVMPFGTPKVYTFKGTIPGPA